MSSNLPARRPRARLFHKLSVLLAAAALSAAGMLATTGVAHADAVIQITDSADPVQANTAYDYVVTIPNTGPNDEPYDVTVDLTGAAATFTGYATDNPLLFCFSVSGTHAHCGSPVPHYPTGTITLHVMPTAAGTVTASAAVTGDVTGSDSTTTTISPAGPTYTFTGFFQPVDNPPTVNSMKAGRAVPIKFSLGGDQGLDIFASGYPVSQNVTCDTGAPIDPVEETTGAGQSSLTYNAATDTYTYVWKTDSAWKNTCRTFDLKLGDNSDHYANFKFS
ncbi:PxKF domain-containing protein [Streptomyces sp. NPDC050095]|uniref:PxKF domain-containing protein n=1 Tax=unclassified Streptomyces TaxID=2593676 RepID=UPI0034176835